MRLPLAILAALVLAAGATADSIVVPLTVRPGSLSLAPASVVARAGQATVNVIDARGKGSGWELLARVPALRPVVLGVAARCLPHSTCTLPRTSLRYPIVLNPLRPTVVYRAQPRTGMGAIGLTLRLGGVLGASAVRFLVRSS
ncbi:MAG TPA: hypothetical protein VLJ76_10760 [Gaiellaceae bacterium]|nr:hypothetical protein [Gaiellaceae bacterium]